MSNCLKLHVCCSEYSKNIMCLNNIPNSIQIFSKIACGKVLNGELFFDGRSYNLSVHNIPNINIFTFDIFTATETNLKMQTTLKDLLHNKYFTYLQCCVSNLS